MKFYTALTSALVAAVAVDAAAINTVVAGDAGLDARDPATAPKHAAMKVSSKVAPTKAAGHAAMKVSSKVAPTKAAGHAAMKVSAAAAPKTTPTKAAAHAAMKVSAAAQQKPTASPNHIVNTPKPSTPAAAVNQGYLDQSFIDLILRSTNEYRALNQAGPISWSSELASYAQSYADKCVFQHSGGPYGENLAAGGYNNPAYYVYLWYNEIHSYKNYAEPDFSTFESWGHFSQLVWKDVTKVGCGWATTCGNLDPYGPYYLVCEYDNGNILPESNFPANVLPATKAEPAPPASVVSVSY